MSLLILPNGLPAAVTTTSATITDGTTYVSYDIRVRDSSLNLVGEVTDWTKLTIIKRFNNVGQATLLLNKDDPMAVYLMTPGYGLIIGRTITNSAGVVLSRNGAFFSGQAWEYKRENKSGQKTVQIVAYDDLVWLATRDAYPVTTYPYSGVILAESGLKRYYRLGEPNGTTATDSSSAVNGTYNGSPTLGVAGGIDDSDTAVTFNGTSQYVSAAATGLPTGNGAWSIECWVYPITYPVSGNAFIASFGSNAAKSNPLLFINSSGALSVTGNSWGDTGGVTIPLAKWSHVVGTWDGTTMRCYLNGAQVGTPTTPGAMTTGTTGVAIAANMATGNYLHGTVDEVAIYNVALSAAQISNHYTIGLSRFASQATDTQTGNAETVIQHFANVNAGAGAVDVRQTPNLVMGTNNNNGSTVKGVGTFDRLISKDGTGLLQRLALASSPVLGFQVAQSGNTLTFSCYVPADQTSNAIFSDDIGNLGDFSYEVKGPDWEQGGNALVVGGSGTGTSRTYYLITDSGSVSSWGRVESFLDQSNTTDSTALANAAAAAILKLKDQSSMTLQLVPQSALTYGIDFGLGDKVTYVIDGTAYNDIVREVQIDLDPANGETVTPAVGSPNTAAIMHGMARYIQDTQYALAQMRNRVANIERRSS